MKNQRIAIGIGAFFLLLILILSINQYFRTKVYYNDTAVNGNSDGNLYNCGLFCSDGERIYFSNPSDHGALYSMSLSGDDYKKITDDCAWYINVDEHYIYYARNNFTSEGIWGLMARNEYGLCRIDKNGKHRVCLDSQPCMGVSLIGNQVYYFRYEKETATQLYRISIDGKDKECIFESPIWAAASDGNGFYYSGVSDDHDLHYYNCESGASNTVLSGNYYMPMVDQGYLYYLNLEEGYTLWRMNLQTKEQEPIIGKRIDTYNVSGDSIVYQTAAETNNGIFSFHMVTKVNTLLANGTYCDINIIGDKVYFHEFENSEEFYCSSLEFPTISNFTPGVES